MATDNSITSAYLLAVHAVEAGAITTDAASCPVAAIYEASENIDGDEYDRLVRAANSLTPRSIEGAHHQIVAADIALDALDVDLDALSPAEMQDRLAGIKAAIGRLLAFTSEATGLPG